MTRMLTYDEASAKLCVSKATLERMVREGSVPSYFISGRRVFSASELDTWVQQYREGDMGGVVKLSAISELIRVWEAEGFVPITSLKQVLTSP